MVVGQGPQAALSFAAAVSARVSGVEGVGKRRPVLAVESILFRLSDKIVPRARLLMLGGGGVGVYARFAGLRLTDQ